MPLFLVQSSIAAWQAGFSLLDRIASLIPRPSRPSHLEIGRLGEEAGFFYLRRVGFTVIAKGWTSGRAPGDLDLVAWEKDTLCFVEVKTRTGRGFATAEAAVDRAKRRNLRRMAGHYLRQMPEGTLSRFDILSVYLNSDLSGGRAEFELFRNAFDWTDSSTDN